MSFARQETRRPGAPLTPLIDLLFILIIFFVTTTSFRQEERQIDVNLVSARSGESSEPSATEIVINVMADGAILIGNRAFEPDQLDQTLRKIVADFPDERVIVRGDKSAAYERVLAVVDAARAAGIRNINLATVRHAREVGG